MSITHNFFFLKSISLKRIRNLAKKNKKKATHLLKVGELFVVAFKRRNCVFKIAFCSMLCINACLINCLPSLHFALTLIYGYSSVPDTDVTDGGS